MSSVSPQTRAVVRRSSSSRATPAREVQQEGAGSALSRCVAELRRARTWEQSGNNSARTPGKTRGEGRPGNKTSQQDRCSGPVCKTSIPGSIRAAPPNSRKFADSRALTAQRSEVLKKSLLAVVRVTVKPRPSHTCAAVSSSSSGLIWEQLGNGLRQKQRSCDDSG
jgi:hypothetical protein